MRIDGKGLIDRKQPVAFTFNKQSYMGFAGDTMASALLANNVHLVGRQVVRRRIMVPPRRVRSGGRRQRSVRCRRLRSDRHRGRCFQLRRARRRRYLANPSRARR